MKWLESNNNNTVVYLYIYNSHVPDNVLQKGASETFFRGQQMWVSLSLPSTAVIKFCLVSKLVKLKKN